MASENIENLSPHSCAEPTNAVKRRTGSIIIPFHVIALCSSHPHISASILVARQYWPLNRRESFRTLILFSRCLGAFIM